MEWTLVNLSQVNIEKTDDFFSSFSKDIKGLFEFVLIKEVLDEKVKVFSDFSKGVFVEILNYILSKDFFLLNVKLV